MAKNRKTKKDKIRASARHTSASRTGMSSQATSPVHHSSVFTYNSSSTVPSSAARAVSAEQTLHLRDDLLRTIIVTGAIVLAELMLFFSLSSH